MAELVRRVGLSREQNKQIGALSKGYRQRVGLAQALIHDPDVLILDEPTTGLDPNQILEIRQLIREVGEDKTVIFSTHILPEVTALCSRVLIISRGKLVADSPVAELAARAAGETVVRAEFEGEGMMPASWPSCPACATSKPRPMARCCLIRTAPGTDVRAAVSRLAGQEGWLLLGLAAGAAEFGRGVWGIDEVNPQHFKNRKMSNADALPNVS